MRAYISQQRLHFTNRKSIIVRLTNGFGNNLFQTIAGQLLSHKHNRQLKFRCASSYYGLSELNNFGFQGPLGTPSKRAYEINETNLKQHLDGVSIPGEAVLRGYFENYTYFIEHRDLIKSWLPPITDKYDGLTVHFRTGDRLFYKEGWSHKTTESQWRKAINDINPKRLRIVTDFPQWKEVTPKELNQMKFHVNVPLHERVSPTQSCGYINELISMFNEYRPESILNQSITEDFNALRNSEQILFEHGTLSWWASFLSEASHVGVYGPWRDWKGEGNRNLSNTPISTWKQWH